MKLKFLFRQFNTFDTLLYIIIKDLNPNQIPYIYVQTIKTDICYEQLSSTRVKEHIPKNGWKIYSLKRLL